MIPFWMRLETWAARWDCHRSLWCCQYVDLAMCNTWNDPHFIARLAFRLRAWTQQLVEWVLADTDPSDLSDGDECAGMGCSPHTPCSWECERRFEEDCDA